MNYYDKYLKYKNKYLKLKKLIGGENEYFKCFEEDLNFIKSSTNNEHTLFFCNILLIFCELSQVIKTSNESIDVFDNIYKKYNIKFNTYDVDDVMIKKYYVTIYYELNDILSEFYNNEKLDHRNIIFLNMPKSKSYKQLFNDIDKFIKSIKTSIIIKSSNVLKKYENYVSNHNKFIQLLSYSKDLPGYIKSDDVKINEIIQKYKSSSLNIIDLFILLFINEKTDYLKKLLIYLHRNEKCYILKKEASIIIVELMIEKESKIKYDELKLFFDNIIDEISNLEFQDIILDICKEKETIEISCKENSRKNDLFCTNNAENQEIVCKFN
jgi:hypothetical protein